VPAFGNTDIDISTWLKIYDILLKTEESAALLLYSVGFHLQYLKSVWSLHVHKSSVDKLAHSDKDSADD